MFHWRDSGDTIPFCEVEDVVNLWTLSNNIEDWGKATLSDGRLSGTCSWNYRARPKRKVTNISNPKIKYVLWEINDISQVSIWLKALILPQQFMNQSFVFIDIVSLLKEKEKKKNKKNNVPQRELAFRCINHHDSKTDRRQAKKLEEIIIDCLCS